MTKKSEISAAVAVSKANPEERKKLIKRRNALLEASFQHVESYLESKSQTDGAFNTFHLDAKAWLDDCRKLREMDGKSFDDLEDINLYWLHQAQRFGWGDQTAKVKGEKIDPSLGTLRSLHRKGAENGVNFNLNFYAFREEVSRVSPKSEGRGRAKPSGSAKVDHADGEHEAIANKGTPLQSVHVLPGLLKVLLEKRDQVRPEMREAFDKAMLHRAEEWIEQAHKATEAGFIQ